MSRTNNRGAALSELDQVRLRTLVRERGLLRAAKAVRSSEYVTAKAAAGIPISRAVAIVISASLPQEAKAA